MPHLSQVCQNEVPEELYQQIEVKVCASDINYRGEPMAKGDAHCVPLSTTTKFLSCFLVSVYGTISLLRKSQTHRVISTYHLHNTLPIYVLSIKKHKTIR